MRGCHCNFSFKNLNNFQQMNQLLGTFQASSTRSDISGENKSYKVKSMGSSRGKFQLRIFLFFLAMICCADVERSFPSHCKENSSSGSHPGELHSQHSHKHTHAQVWHIYPNMRIHTFADITTDNFTFKTSHGDPHTHIHLSQSSLLVETHACNRHQPNTCRQ